MVGVHFTLYTPPCKGEKRRETEKKESTKRERRQRKVSIEKREKTDKCKSRMYGSGSLERQR
jgi:hypothetical protein